MSLAPASHSPRAEVLEDCVNSLLKDKDSMVGDESTMRLHYLLDRRGHGWWKDTSTGLKAIVRIFGELGSSFNGTRLSTEGTQEDLSDTWVRTHSDRSTRYYVTHLHDHKNASSIYNS